MTGILEPKENFFSPTVCRLEHYLQNGFAPIDSNTEVGQALLIAICHENGDAMFKFRTVLHAEQLPVTYVAKRDEVRRDGREGQHAVRLGAAARRAVTVRLLEGAANQISTC